MDGGVGHVRLEDVPHPTMQAPTAAIVRVTASAICGTDLHFIRGTMPGTEEGRILGHEGVGPFQAEVPSRTTPALTQRSRPR